MNRKGGEILGQRRTSRSTSCPERPSSSSSCCPPRAFEEAIDASLAAGAHAIVAITAGLGEVDDAGKEIEHRVVERVRAAGAVMLGPNCLGVYDAAASLDLGHE